MSDYIDFLLYGSLENSDSDDSDYCPSGDSYPDSGYPSQSSQSSQSERTFDPQFILKLYHNYIYGL